MLRFCLSFPIPNSSSRVIWRVRLSCFSYRTAVAGVMANEAPTMTVMKGRPKSKKGLLFIIRRYLTAIDLEFSGTYFLDGNTAMLVRSTVSFDDNKKASSKLRPRGQGIVWHGKSQTMWTRLSAGRQKSRAPRPLSSARDFAYLPARPRTPSVYHTGHFIYYGPSVSALFAAGLA